MKQKCILINPWIYDFAAMNFWSRPLGLLKVAEYLSQFDLDPLLTNNSVFSRLYSGYNPCDLERLKLDVKEYNSSH